MQPDEHSSANQFTELRQQAEDILLHRLQDMPSQWSTDIHSLVHELKVHQIEMEMQNDELRQAQTSLEASHERYVALYDFAPVGYFTINDRSLIIEANLTAARLLGVEHKELIDRRLTDFINREDQDTYYLFSRRLFNTQALQVCELGLIRPDGARFDAHLEAVTESAPAGELLCRMAVSDVTQRKQADAELQQYREHLEYLVEQRTAELKQANEQLRQEIKQRRQIAARLKVALQEKEALLSEVHHRVKNNLQTIVSLIGLRENQIQDNQSVDFLKELQGQVRTMAMVHSQLYQSKNMAQVTMPHFFDGLIPRILDAFGHERSIETQLDVASVDLDIYKAIPCAMIVNELVTNSFKHAFPPGFEKQPVLRVSMKQDGDTFTLIVADNGVGLPAGLDWQSGPTLGLHLVHLWATSQLSGTLDVVSAEGVTYTITFKNSAPRGLDEIPPHAD